VIELLCLDEVNYVIVIYSLVVVEGNAREAFAAEGYILGLVS